VLHTLGLVLILLVIVGCVVVLCRIEHEPSPGAQEEPREGETVAMPVTVKPRVPR
jgi:hypothetical protein